MTALVEREEAKRLINAHVAECFRLAGHKGLPVILHPGPVADAILALRQPGAEYRRGVEDAAKVAADYAVEFAEKAERAASLPIPRTHERRIFEAHHFAGKNLATAIRALSDSIPDTKGGE